jgi:hypothetical protein
VDDDSEAQSDLSAFEVGSDGDDAGANDANGAADDAEKTDVSGGRAGTEANASRDGTDAGPAAGRPVGELDREERVELGVDLLAHLEAEELSLSAAVDRIETVTTNPTLTREILDTAELRGVIGREEGRILTRRGGAFVRFESQVVRRDGDFSCRRCGAGLSTGHFVRFEAGELGPFGSSCIRKVLGRD